MTEDSAKMIYRTLGSTGEKVSAIGVGGWHLALHTSMSRSPSALCAAPSIAVSIFSTTAGTTTKERARSAWEGPERRLSRQGVRDDENRWPLEKGAAKQLDESLRRLQVDCIDLVITKFCASKIHIGYLIRKARMPALIEARDAGKLRYIVSPDTRIRKSICTRSK